MAKVRIIMLCSKQSHVFFAVFSRFIPLFMPFARTLFAIINFRNFNDSEF